MKLNLKLHPSIECLEVDNEIVMLNNETQAVCVANEAMCSIVKYLAEYSTDTNQLRKHFLSLYDGVSTDVLTRDFEEALQLLTDKKIIEHV